MATISRAADTTADAMSDLENHIEAAFRNAAEGFAPCYPLRFKCVEAHDPYEDGSELTAEVFIGETLQIDPDNLEVTARYLRKLADQLERIA